MGDDDVGDAELAEAVGDGLGRLGLAVDDEGAPRRLGHRAEIVEQLGPVATLAGRRIGSDRLRMLFDTYHMRVMEGDLVKHIERNIDVIGHFHAAGVPGRHEVFNGETNYPFVLNQLERLGFQGAFGLEYSQSIDDETSLRQSLEYLSRN